MKNETAGDPMSGLKWTRRTTAKIAAELHQLGIQVSDRTVAALLKKMGSRFASTTRSSPAPPIPTATPSSTALPSCVSALPPRTHR